jgi:hypothetical protein
MKKIAGIVLAVFGMWSLIFTGCTETKKSTEAPKPAASQITEKQSQSDVKKDVSEKDHDMMNKLQELVK